MRALVKTVNRAERRFVRRCGSGVLGIKRKMLQVQPSYVTNKPRVAAWDMTGNMCLRTLIANHAQASQRGPEGLVL